MNIVYIHHAHRDNSKGFGGMQAVGICPIIFKFDKVGFEAN